VIKDVLKGVRPPRPDNRHVVGMSDNMWVHVQHWWNSDLGRRHSIPLTHAVIQHSIPSPSQSSSSQLTTIGPQHPLPSPSSSPSTSLSLAGTHHSLPDIPHENQTVPQQSLSSILVWDGSISGLDIRSVTGAEWERVRSNWSPAAQLDILQSVRNFYSTLKCAC
jgi:hypothetical protein